MGLHRTVPRDAEARLSDLPSLAQVLPLPLPRVPTLLLLHAPLLLLGQSTNHFLVIQTNIKSLFYAFLVRVPYESPVDSAADIVMRAGKDIHRVHFCGSREV